MPLEHPDVTLMPNNSNMGQPLFKMLTLLLLVQLQPRLKVIEDTTFLKQEHASEDNFQALVLLLILAMTFLF